MSAYNIRGSTFFNAQSEQNIENLIIKSKKEIFLFYLYISVLSFICNVGFSLFTPFLPLEMEKKGYDPGMTGPIMAVYSFSHIIISLNVSKLTKFMKRRNFLTLCSTTYGIIMFLLAFLMQLEI